MGAYWATAYRGGRSKHQHDASRNRVGVSEFFGGDVHPESSRRILGCKLNKMAGLPYREEGKGGKRTGVWLCGFTTPPYFAFVSAFGSEFGVTCCLLL